MAFSITFRPSVKEFDKYSEEFTDRFLKKFKDNKYLIAEEKGNSDFVNHYQIFLESDKRLDNIKRTFNKVILKDMDIGFPKVALRIKSVKTNPTGIVGYCLKEQDGLDSVVSNYDAEYLIKCRDEYLSMSHQKKKKVDMIRVRLANLPEVYSNYCEGNNIDVKVFKENRDVGKVLGRMAQEGYYLLPIYLRKDYESICKYLLSYGKGMLEEHYSKFLFTDKEKQRIYDNTPWNERR